LRFIKTTDENFEASFRGLLERGEVFSPEVWRLVEEIVGAVASRGDEALFHYTRRFDGVEMTPGAVRCTDDEIEEAAAEVPEGDRSLLERAARRIEAFHRRQVPGGWMEDEGGGTILGQITVPLGRVGVYTPGGLAAYPSTVLMAAIPARVAGVGEVILCSPLREGRLNPLVAAAARIAGVDGIYKVGGAQAVAAMAFGTESVPRVDKIVGPGNAYVAAAKKAVFGHAAIDMVAGPSEVLVIGDGTVPPVFAAADLLAQAEHDERASAVLLTPDESYGRAVMGEVERLLGVMARREIAHRSLASYGAVIVTRDLKEAVELANRFAPEHLELQTAAPEALLPAVRNAGAVFLGPYTPETLGDYLAGPNHILPTSGTARFFSALGVYDFVKRISVLSFSEASFERHGPDAERFAVLEGLEGHAAAVRVRREAKNTLTKRPA